MSDLYPPPADTSVATVPAAPPLTRLIRLASINPAEIRDRSFGGGFLDRDDPLEGAGIFLNGFSFASSYPVDPDKHQTIIQQLFGNVYGHVHGNTIPGTEVQVVDFDDVRTGRGESARRYVLIDRETQRSTRMSVFATFRSYGDYLYVSVDSYVLPPLALGRPILLLLLIYFIMKSATQLLGMFSGSAVLFLWMVVLSVLAWNHRGVLRSMRAGDSFVMALRRKYHSHGYSGTFNADDVLMHFKSTTLMIVEAMQGVFEKNDIPLDLLNRVRENINMSASINVSGGILNFIGNLVGGSGNNGGGNN
jgi:hypothetical protein